MHFVVISTVSGVETIARGVSVLQRKRLRKRFGGESWRKMKGFALVRLADGATCRVELHWYEAHGVGRRQMKIKRILE